MYSCLQKCNTEVHCLVVCDTLLSGRDLQTLLRNVSNNSRRLLNNTFHKIAIFMVSAVKTSNTTEISTLRLKRLNSSKSHIKSKGSNSKTL